ncbi:transcriptional regulator [candidate division WOR-3 bacterium]|nr:transcriptional regulator [candidate division WOR-3 bacterium]
MPTPEPESQELQPLAAVDRVIHEPARLAILGLLAGLESADFLFVQNQTGLTGGNLSSHMTRLEEAGYVEVKKEFVDRIPRTLLRATKKGRAALRQYKRTMQQVLGGLSV